MTKLRVLKGGPGSGNFGHAGRPGKVGGSSSGTGDSGKQWIKTVEDKQAWLAERRVYDPKDYANNWDKVHKGSTNVDIVDLASSAYEYHDEATGIYTKVVALDIDPNLAVVGGTVYDANGERIGGFSRTIALDRDTGSLHIYNDTFRLDSGHQAAGFGRRFYENQEEVAKAAGVGAIELTANDTVGGYAWARMGYVNKYDSEHSRMVSSITHKYAQHAGLANSWTDEVEATTRAKFTSLSTWQIAAFEVDGVRIGKQALLGTHWKAVKYLRDDDPGYQAGRLYYGLK